MKKIIFILITSIFFFSCEKDIIENTKPLEFSTDTIIFDTSFFSVGTPTKTLKVYNRNNAIIRTNINLISSNQGSFRINVNGVSGRSFNNVMIYPNDSIFIFIEVTADNSNNDFLLTTKIEFLTNDNTQRVDLVAPYRDAYFHILHDNLFITQLGDTVNYRYYQINENTIWTNDKEHVVYGTVVIEPNVVLTIEEGTKIYFHSNSGIYIGNPLLSNNNAKIIVNGTLENKVIFSSDRLEERYRDLPGQWNGIRFVPGTSENTINYANIENAVIGIQSDSSINNKTTVTIQNTIIKNMSAVGILGQGSNILANNSIVSNCGIYTLACNIGGNYNFKHCTFINNWIYDNRNTPSILLNNYYEDQYGNIILRELSNAFFGNCIIYGNLSTEISFDKNESATFDYTFDHCLIKIDPNTELISNRFISCLLNEDPMIVNIEENEFGLEENSPAIDAGNESIVQSDLNLITDFFKNNREINPDLGAIEKN